MIKAILYDLDGVLVEAVEIHFAAFNMALEEVVGIKIGRDEEEDFNGLPTRKKLEKLAADGRISAENQGLIWEKKQDHTKEAIIKTLNIDIEKLILHNQVQSQGILSACVTNSITETAELMLRVSGQWPYMEFLISNDMVNHPKPHGEGYIRAMVRLGLYPDQVLIVEDSDRGVAAAKSTGAHLLRVKDSSEVNWKNIAKVINES